MQQLSEYSVGVNTSSDMNGSFVFQEPLVLGK
jgi:hypothetical protein